MEKGFKPDYLDSSQLREEVERLRAIIEGRAAEALAAQRDANENRVIYFEGAWGGKFTFLWKECKTWEVEYTI